ncbi:MAG: hypothetical protein QOI15_608, partial [Pseudonocardiales bacterium]|nr:hypothetical protein [Pseudonocardiales bacterium]
MAGAAEQIRTLLADARAARLAKDIVGARAAYARSFDQARDSGDIPEMCEAALGLAGVQAYGMHAGRIPAYLFEAYSAADGPYRIRLAAAIARTWAYSGDPVRGARFAEEAVAAARESGDAGLLAEALDAELLMHWGPDDLAERVRIAALLEDTVAYLPDIEARMSAHLWQLTTGLENLDRACVLRQLRGLELLADESGSPRVRFFERSRQAMYALVIGDTDAARTHRAASIRAGTEAGEADVLAIEHVLAAEIARQAGDVDTLFAEAAGAEEYGTAEGVPTVLAEAADLWLAAGEPERARSLLLQVAGAGLAAIPRELDWLLATTLLTSVAAATGERELAAEGLALLEPYAGRGVPNGGAVIFSGVVDTYLARAAAAVGRADDAARWAESGRTLAARLGSLWWMQAADRIAGPAASSHAPAGAAVVAVLRPGTGGVWTVGRLGAEVAIRQMKGLIYLRLLLRKPGGEISALDLSDWAAGHPGAGLIESSVGELIDRQALTAYRTRLADIDAELAEAGEWGD